jgi:hypothetical protein
MRCEDVAGLLSEAAEGAEISDRKVLAHVDHCLRCQAEAAQYRRLLKALRHLRTQVIEPAPGLVAEILAGIEAAGERRAIRSMLTGRRAAYLSGLAVAGAAASAGAVVLAARARRRKSLKLAS